MLSSALQEKSLNYWYLIFCKRNKFHSQLCRALVKLNQEGGGGMGAGSTLEYLGHFVKIPPPYGRSSDCGAKVPPNTT